VLGINVHDSTLRHDVERLQILPELSCMAQFRWSELHNAESNHSLTLAITQELQQKYQDHKRSKESSNN
jgi:hypothetical protein